MSPAKLLRGDDRPFRSTLDRPTPVAVALMKPHVDEAISWDRTKSVSEPRNKFVRSLLVCGAPLNSWLRGVISLSVTFPERRKCEPPGHVCFVLHVNDYNSCKLALCGRSSSLLLPAIFSSPQERCRPYLHKASISCVRVSYTGTRSACMHAVRIRVRHRKSFSLWVSFGHPSGRCWWGS